MNTAIFEGNWKSLKVKEQWGKLTNDDLDVIDGRRDQGAEKIQERYGIIMDAAAKQLKACDGKHRH